MPLRTPSSQTTTPPSPESFCTSELSGSDAPHTTLSPAVAIGSGAGAGDASIARPLTVAGAVTATTPYLAFGGAMTTGPLSSGSIVPAEVRVRLSSEKLSPSPPQAAARQEQECGEGARRGAGRCSDHGMAGLVGVKPPEGQGASQTWPIGGSTGEPGAPQTTISSRWYRRA